MGRRSSAEVAADREMVARIVASLNSSVAAVERAMVLLYKRQTATEQEAEITTEHNAVGFAANDATVATRITKNVILKAYAAGVPEGSRLWGSSLEIARRIAKRYAATQLLEAAKAKAEARKLAMLADEAAGREAMGRPVAA